MEGAKCPTLTLSRHMLHVLLLTLLLVHAMPHFEAGVLVLSEALMIQGMRLYRQGI